MAHATLIKAAAKDYPEQGIKKGEPYYKWSFRFGGVHRSKTPPKQSQLTQSEFLSTLYSIQEDMAEIKVTTRAEMKSEAESIVERIESLRDDTQEKLDNMPDGLREGDTGQLLEERVEAMDNWISEIQGIEGIDSDGEVEEGEEGDGRSVDEILEEFQNTDPGL